jgi:CyaY protein
MPHAAASAAAASATPMRARRPARTVAKKSRNIDSDPSTRRPAHGKPELMTTDSEFIAAADRVLETIGAALDAALAHADVDVDWNLNDGILEIECEGGSKLIVNRHVPNREIWVAARSGGFHFAPRDGAWRDTRAGTELGAALVALLRAQASLEIGVPALAVPA